MLSLSRILSLAFVSVLLTSGTVSANPLKQTFEEAMMAFYQQDYDRAIGLFKKTLVMKPDFAPSYNFIGMAMKEQGEDLNEVAEYFQKAVDYSPRYADAYANLGKAYYSLGDFEKSKEACLKALEIKPDSVSANLALAWTYLLGMSQPEDAIPHFERVIGDTNMAYAFFGLGMAYFMNGQRIEVFDMITKLKRDGANDLAEELEAMVRDKTYERITKPGTPLIAPRGDAAKLVRDAPPPDISASPEADMKVRMRSLSTSHMDSVTDQNPNPSAADRIRALQDHGRSAYPLP